MEARIAFRQIRRVDDVSGGITHWECSACGWTSPIVRDFRGLVAPQETTQGFAGHDCRNHPTVGK